jgi:hypothetical protein
MKRSGLIPILDRVVEIHYWCEHRVEFRKLDWGRYAVAMMREFHKDLFGAEPLLRRLAEEMRGLGKPISECRVFEVLMWTTLAPRKR